VFSAVSFSLVGVNVLLHCFADKPPAYLDFKGLNPGD
jgi:hypothetical protein